MPGTIYLPNQAIVVNSTGYGVAITSQPDSGIVQIPNYSDVHLGYVRRLSTISATVTALAQYTTAASVGSLPGLSSLALITFQLYVNNIAVYNQTSQITLPSSGFSNQLFNTNTSYGIYADLVNPILLRNGDALAMRIALGVDSAYLEVPPASGSGASVTYVCSAANLNTMQGIVTYNETQDA